MEKLIQLNTVTQAMRARDILKASKIRSKVKRIPSSDGRSPCSYGLIIFNNYDEAIKTLKDNNISGRALGGKL